MIYLASQLFFWWIILKAIGTSYQKILWLCNSLYKNNLDWKNFYRQLQFNFFLKIRDALIVHLWATHGSGTEDKIKYRNYVISTSCLVNSNKITMLVIFTLLQMFSNSSEKYIFEKYFVVFQNHILTINCPSKLAISLLT